MKLLIASALVVSLSGFVASFVLVKSSPRFVVGSDLVRVASSSNPSTDDTASTTVRKIVGDLKVPLTWDEMIRQVASACSKSSETRQIVRVLLPRDAQNANFGTFYESDNESSSMLVPPDESWQGGIMQLYRAAAPTAKAILRQIQSIRSSTQMTTRIVEDRTVDESGVDGIGIMKTQDNILQCYVQPTQEIVDELVKAAESLPQSESEQGPMVILLNPQWRQVDDALDTASKKQGFIGNLANFLGGKGSAIQRLQESGYRPVYQLEGYVCRGANVRLLQVGKSDWHVFFERDDGESYLCVGTTPARPTYQQVDEMLQRAKIGFKYARDIGLQPKL
jgi:hypothetical protein